MDQIDVSTEEFFENLFLSAEKNGGNSYFYPSQDGSMTTCRFEWHQPWRNRAAAVRVGVVFELEKGEKPSVATAYFATEEMYAKDGQKPKIERISKTKYVEMQRLLNDYITNASSSVLASRLTRRLFVFYVQLPQDFIITKGFSVKHGAVRVLPSKVHDQKHVAAVLVKSRGKTRRDAQRNASEIFSLFTAMGSLATGALWVRSEIQDAPEEVTGAIDRFKISDLDKIYLSGFKPVLWEAQALHNSSKSLIRNLCQQYEFFDPKKKETVRHALFAHYGALKVSSENKALAIVGYLACLGSLSKSFQAPCPGNVFCEDCGRLHSHNLVGDRKAITLHIESVLSKWFQLSEQNAKGLDAWIKRLYNKHRSQFVHSASHRFNEYNQRNHPNPRSGSPTAIPSESRVVSELNEFISDFHKLSPISRFMLIAQFEECIKHLKHDSQFSFEVPDFVERFTEEAFVGSPTSGRVEV